MYSLLQGKKILLGVCGTIMLDRGLELLRILKRDGFVVNVVMTADAASLISPQLFQAVSGKPVSLSKSNYFDGVLHKADVFVVCPASVDVIRRSRMFLCAACPVIVCPAVDSKTWELSSVQNNLLRLRKAGIMVSGPIQETVLADIESKVHIVSLHEIEWYVIKCFVPQDLAGKNVVVSAGPMREWFDDGSFISCASSGKIGYALAKVAALRGAAVYLISGSTLLDEPIGVRRLFVDDTQALKQAVLRLYSWMNVYISAACVPDYQSVLHCMQKNAGKNSRREFVLRENLDILGLLAKKRAKAHTPLLVGFSLEREHVVERASKKLARKKVDMMVAHTPAAAGPDQVEICLLSAYYRNGIADSKLQCLTMSKEAAAWYVFDRILSLF